LVEKFPAVLEILPQVLRGGFFFDSHCRHPTGLSYEPITHETPSVKGLQKVVNI